MKPGGAGGWQAGGSCGVFRQQSGIAARGHQQQVAQLARCAVPAARLRDKVGGVADLGLGVGGGAGQGARPPEPGTAACADPRNHRYTPAAGLPALLRAVKLQKRDNRTLYTRDLNRTFAFLPGADSIPATLRVMFSVVAMSTGKTFWL